MNIISYIINFKENLNIPRCTQLLTQMSDAAEAHASSIRIDEHTAAACSDPSVPPVSKVCEGYQFSIVFNGELTDTEELKKELSRFGYGFLTDSDAELALNCYIHFGTHCTEKLGGSYSFIIHDSMRRQIFAATDFFASEPLFYCRTENEIIISSGIRALLSYPGITAKVSSSALKELLSVPTHCTGNIFDGINRLPPSHYLIIKGENISEHEYSLPTDRRTADDIIYSRIPKHAGILYCGSAADNLLIHPESKISHVYPLWHSSFSAHDLNYGLKASVDAHALPLLSDNDFLIPNALKNADTPVIISAHPFSDTATAQSNFAHVLIKNNAFHKAVSDTLDFQNCLTIPHSFLSAAPVMCAKAGFKPIMPCLSHGVYEQSAYIPYLHFKPDADMPEIRRYRTEAEQKILQIAKRELLSVISTPDSPVNAFFNRPALLRLCAGKFDFPDISELTLITYILKLNIWFLNYRPMLI